MQKFSRGVSEFGRVCGTSARGRWVCVFLWGGGGLHGVQYGSKRHLRDVLPQVCGLLLPQRQPAGDAGCGPAVARAGGSVLRCRCTGRGWAGLYEGWVGGCVVEQGRWPSFRLAVLPPFSHHDDSVACCPPPSCSADWLHMPTATCPRWTSACAPPSRYGSRACCWVTVERSCARVGSCAGAAAGSVARRTAAMHTRNAALAPPLLCSSLHLIFPPPPPLCPQLGALAEFRSDWAAALRMYGEAAGYIPQLLAAAGGAQPQRYAEVRAVAEQMHIKVSWQGGERRFGSGAGRPVAVHACCLLCVPAACHPNRERPGQRARMLPPNQRPTRPPICGAAGHVPAAAGPQPSAGGPGSV